MICPIAGWLDVSESSIHSVTSPGAAFSEVNWKFELIVIGQVCRGDWIPATGALADRQLYEATASRRFVHAAWSRRLDRDSKPAPSVAASCPPQRTPRCGYAL